MHPLVRAVVAVVSAGGLLAVGGAAPRAQQADLPALIAQYRTGDADTAVKTLAMWSAARIGRADTHIASTDSLGRLAAAVMMREAEESLLNPDVNALTQLLRRSNAEIGDVCLDRTLDARIAPLCRTALRVIVGGLGDEDIDRRVAAAFSDDPVLQTQVGAHFEYWILGVDDGHSGYGKDYELSAAGPRLAETTSHGLIFKDPASRAEAAFREALLADPSFSEARVRLGHVLWLSDHSAEAENEWKTVLANSHGRPAMAYLAGLFLGQLYEEQKRVADAEQAYRTAIESDPDGQAGRTALAKLLLASGREAEGWRTLNEGLTARRAVSPDPWILYAMSDTWWARFGALRTLRAAVRQ
jgi:tetratricopeptide (TPR) repeat protein